MVRARSRLLHVVSTDTGGRFAWTEVQTRTATTDAIVPEVLAFAPGWNERISQEDLAIRATFSEAMNPASLTPDSFQLLDDSFGQNFGAGQAVALSADERTLIASDLAEDAHFWKAVDEPDAGRLPEDLTQK